MKLILTSGRVWGQEEKGTTEDEMAGWHHWLDGLESEWTPGIDDGQGGLACCDSGGRKESDTTEQLIWSDLIWSEYWPNTILGEGICNPLQYSCLENPLDRGTWWAAVHSVTQSWTWLKRLSIHACIGEENSNPLQYSCLETPRDRGAWGAAVYGAAQRLSSRSSIEEEKWKWKW